MSKKLRVVEAFFTAETGDIFEFDKNSGMYITTKSEEFYKTDANNPNETRASYSSDVKISADYAKELVEEGVLEEIKDTEDVPFVNIFNEIDDLLSKYKIQLDNIHEDMNGLPACIKVERETVLSNLITVLEHLKSLKK